MSDGENHEASWHACDPDDERRVSRHADLQRPFVGGVLWDDEPVTEVPVDEVRRLRG